MTPHGKIQRYVPAEYVAHFVRVHFQQRPVAWASRGDHHVIDWGGQGFEEAVQGIVVGGIECRSLLSSDVVGGFGEPVRIAAGEYHVGAVSACASGRLQADAGAATDQYDGLAG